VETSRAFASRLAKLARPQRQEAWPRVLALLCAYGGYEHITKKENKFISPETVFFFLFSFVYDLHDFSDLPDFCDFIFAFFFRLFFSFF
jgi:hypothetical protein